MSDVIDLTEATWDARVRDSALPVLVVFSAPWCGACRQFEPTVAKLATRLAGVAAVGKLNTDNARRLAHAHDVTALPTVVLFWRGDELGRKVGGQSEAWFVDWVTSSIPPDDAIIAPEPLPEGYYDD